MPIEYDTHTTDTKHTVELTTYQLRTLLALVQSMNQSLEHEADPAMLEAEEILRMG